MQMKNDRIYNQNETNRMEKKKMNKIKDELKYKKKGHGSFSQLQNDPKESNFSLF